MNLPLGDFPDQAVTEWIPLEEAGTEDLLGARLELHLAVQLPAAIGASLIAPRPDHSHSSLVWIGAGRLATELIEAKTPFRAALQLATMQLSVVQESGSVIHVLDLAGRTMDDAYHWLDEQVNSLAGRGNIVQRPDLGEIPYHPVKDGAPFECSEHRRLAELQNWYHDSYLVLTELGGRVAGVSPVRCWPHHFDIAVLINLDDGRPEPASIGVGMTPGDDFCTEPYWYVTPWPYPETAELPRLSGGFWHTGDWVGAVLVGSEVAMPEEARDQAETAWAFLDSAIAGCRKLMG